MQRIKRMLVLAASQPYTRTNMPQYTVASYKCDCGHSGAVQASLPEPHCSKCGAAVEASVGKIAKTVARLEDSKADLVSIGCVKCKQHNLMTTEAAVSFAGDMACANCGTVLAFDVDDVSSDPESEEIDDDTAAEETSSLDDEDKIVDGELPEEDESEVSALDDDGLDDQQNDDDEDYLGGDDAGDDEGETDGDEGDLTTDQDETDGDGGGELDDVATPSEEAKVRMVNPLHSMDKKLIAKARLVAEDETRVHAFVGNVCVASLLPTKSNASVFGSQAHLTTIASSLKKHGLEAVIADYGFKVNRVAVKTDAVLANAVSSASRKAEATFDKKVKTYAGVMQQSLAIAASGMTRDMFRDVGNPLKDSFFAVLCSVGVKKEEAIRLVQKAFAESGDDYATALLAKATELASKGDDSRNQLATTLAGLNPPQPLDADTDEDEGDEQNDDDLYEGADEPTVESRLKSPMVRSTSTASTTSKPSNEFSGLFAKKVAG